MIRTLLAGTFTAALFLLSLGSGVAQTVTTTTGQIRGTVAGAHGGVGGATVEISGPVLRTTTTHGDGSFTIPNVPPGSYEIAIRAAGYVPESRSNVQVFASETVVDVKLSTVGTSALKQIAGVTAKASGGNFNVTSAAVQSISAVTIDERDSPNLRETIESVPGVSLSRSSEYEGNSSAVFDNVIFPVVRGGEPFETGVLIDGHPMYGAASNQGFSVGWIPSDVLQSVDVVKGPGATTPSINNAINGSVNFVTIDPRSAHAGGRFELESDGFGGSIVRFKYADRVTDKLSIALGYQQQESPGPTSGTKQLFILGANNTNAINGAPFASCVGSNCYSSPGANSGAYFAAYGPPVVNVQGLACCTTDESAYSNRGELAKIRYDFSPYLHATVGYFGSQTFQELGTQNLGQYVFAPPAGYAGSVAPGTVNAAMAYGGSSTAPVSGPGYNTAFTADLVGRLGNVTLSAKTIQVNQRQTYANGIPFLGQNSVSSGSAPVTLYGGVATGTTSPSFTTYDGTAATFTPSQGAYTYTYGTNLGGLTLQADIPSGDDLFTLAYDKTQYTPTFSYDYGYVYPPYVATDLAANPYPGNFETIQSLLGRGSIDVAPKIRAVASVYYNRYDAHASVNDNKSFSDYVSQYTAPRLGVTWRPQSDLSVRFAAGSSIAPAVLTNIIGGALPATANSSTSPTYYTESVTNAAVKPETAFGYDGGFDYRFGSTGTVASFDLYTTNLVNQLFTESSPSGTYDGLPLYVVKYANIGRARYEGVEVSFTHDLGRGIFWSAGGSLMRAAPYDLTPSFYSVSGMPNATNLGIINGHNFTGVNTGENGSSNGVSMPYSTGSASLGYHLKRDGFVRLDANYYGPNNQYYEPPFVVLNASAGIPLYRDTQLILSVANLTNVFSSSYPIEQNGYNSGVSPVLLNGLKYYAYSDGPGPSVFRIGIVERLP